MAFPVSDVINRLRNKVDLVQDVKDSIPQDGTQYVITLSKKPVLAGSEAIYLNSITYTTGLFQQIPYYQSAYASGLTGSNILYDINYSRGEVYMYQGSGTVIGSGLNPFAPWNTSTVTAYYQASTYSDYVLASYVSYAVASVEGSLQMGMYVSGLSGIVPPQYRSPQDIVSLTGAAPYNPTDIFVIADDLEIVQELIAQKAAYDILARERRVGAGNAIKIVDGDTQIDTSVNQRYMVELLRDTKADYTDLIKWVMYNMNEGVSLRTINELSIVAGYAGTRSSRVGGAFGPYGTVNYAFPMDAGI